MQVITGYIVAYTYLIFVFFVSYAISRAKKNNEISRNIIHISAGMGWNIYKIFFPATIHPIIISATFVVLTIITVIKKVKFIEREEGTYGTFYYTMSMFVMSVLGYRNPVSFNLFGISILCLSCGDAIANIIGSRFGKKKIYREKTVQGTVACFMGCIAVLSILTRVYMINLNIGGILLLSLLCALTELFSGNFDNIAIPFVVYCCGYILLTDGFNMHLLISGSVGIAMFLFARIFKLLNLSASYMLFYLITLVFYFGNLRAFAALISIFVIIIMIEKVFSKKIEIVTKTSIKESGRRNELQLIANCMAAVISISLYGILKNEAFLIAYFVAMAETIGDSTASGLGVLSKSDPIDICSLKKIQPGISGGISLLGTAMGFAVCIYSGIIYMCFYQGEISRVFVISIIAFGGIVLDSILGSRIQAQYSCVLCGKYTERSSHCGQASRLVKGLPYIDNSKVNLICNIFSCGLAGIIVNFMR